MVICYCFSFYIILFHYIKKHFYLKSAINIKKSHGILNFHDFFYLIYNIFVRISSSTGIFQ